MDRFLDRWGEENVVESSFACEVTCNSDDDDDVEETTAEINVERLIAELEKTDHEDAVRRKQIRRRLEELAEERSFEDTYAFDFEEK